MKCNLYLFAQNLPLDLDLLGLIFRSFSVAFGIFENLRYKSSRYHFIASCHLFERAWNLMEHMIRFTCTTCATIALAKWNFSIILDFQGFL